MPAVVPLIGLAATGISAYMKNRAAKKLSAQQQPLLEAQTANAQQQTRLAEDTNQAGNSLLAQGNPLMGASSNYYMRLLKGDRASMTEAVAPEAGAISEVYRGAQKGLDRQVGLQGGNKEVAGAELSRDRAGKIASLIPGVRPQAAASVGDLGKFGVATGLSAKESAIRGQGSAASVYESLLSGNRQDRESTDRDNSAFGSATGSLLAGLLESYGGGTGGNRGKTSSYNPQGWSS